MDKLNDLLKEYSQDITVGDLDSLKVLRGFIKWLVENDKIDISKLYHDMRLEFWDYYWLLMQLSISDTPIEDLVSYLR